MKGTPGWEARRERFAALARGDWRQLARDQVVRGMMIYDNPEGVRMEAAGLAAAGWIAPPCPLGLDHNLRHQCYHLLTAGRHGIDAFACATILEIGGGFGAMHAALRSRGFRGAYVGHDFPEMLALQNLYADACGIPRPIAAGDLAELAPPAASPDLAIALWSISEMPPESRRAIAAALAPRAWLIGYREEFEGFDVTAWADETLRDARYRWVRVPCCGPGNFYMFGVRQASGGGERK